MKSSMKGLRLLGVTFAALALSWHVATNAEAKDFCVATVSELQAALTLAQANGQDDVIRIVQETYNGNFIYASTQSFGVTLEGGYASGCAARTVDPNNTLLDAGGSGSVLVLSTNLAANFVVDGLAIKHGNVTAAPGGDCMLTRLGT